VAPNYIYLGSIPASVILPLVVLAFSQFSSLLSSIL